MQNALDKTAIGLSLLCAAHCLALPLVLVLLPSLAALQLNYEAFHFWMVIAVLPTSLYALTMGCKQHKRYRLLLLGSVGLILLVSAVVLGEAVIGELGEKALTLVGAAFIAYGHYTNFRLCQLRQHQSQSQHQDCSCHSHSSDAL